ncbi:glycine cleavage system aminomethyltransferase GcvT [bacterium]|nr:glycine cleavage system aminomethyltransferase GcvT [bacterium]MBU1881671.1 glycine cleavage system aminomethyltransferase GcvT [bacterium]
MTEPKKTALYDIHKALGAKLVTFAGYWMPVQYQGIIAEHRRVRSTVGIFDVSHMGEFALRGPDVERFLNKITINNVAQLEVGQVQYSAMCYPEGGIVDDLLLYRFEDHYVMVVNASNLEKDRNWIIEHVPEQGVDLDDISDDITLLAVQGPKALEMLQPITDPDIAELPYYRFVEGDVAGTPAVISRTGYTGELGCEIYAAKSHSRELWNDLIEAGEKFDIQPIGLGARDTLRLEMKFCLYGNDIDQTTNPLEAGLGWITKLKKGDFIGRDAIQAAKNRGLKRKLVGFEVLEKAVPRHGYFLYKDGIKVGEVTSGTHSPSLNRGIGLAYINKNHWDVGTEMELNVRGRRYPARVVETPFYKSK